MKNLALSLRVFCAVALIIFTTACSPRSAAIAPKISAPNYSLLKGVNTYYIAEPVYSSLAVRSAKAESENLHKIIHRAALEHLSMKQLKPSSDVVGGKVCQPAYDLKADACMVITFTDFASRDGTSMQVNQFAHLDYMVELVRVSDKRVVWQDSFTFQDQPMSDDLSSAQKLYEDKGNSFGYASASAVFERSIINMFRQLDEGRTSQFLAK